MDESRHSFALGQMPIDADGRRPQALIIVDNKTRREVAHLTFADDAADILIAELKLAHSAKHY